MITQDKLFIGGEWTKPAGPGAIDVISPITEEVFGRVPESRPANIDRAVAAARDALVFGSVLAVIRYDSLPFGGYKQSGISREFGPEGLASHY